MSKDCYNNCLGFHSGCALIRNLHMIVFFSGTSINNSTLMPLHTTYVILLANVSNCGDDTSSSIFAVINRTSNCKGEIRGEK